MSYFFERPTALSDDRNDQQPPSLVRGNSQYAGLQYQHSPAVAYLGLSAVG
jgi:hypothetical protein